MCLLEMSGHFIPCFPTPVNKQLLLVNIWCCCVDCDADGSDGDCLLCIDKQSEAYCRLRTCLFIKCAAISDVYYTWPIITC